MGVYANFMNGRWDALVLLAADYDIREINEELYLALLSHCKGS